MNEPSASAALLEPLLMELARAVRACKFYGRRHPTGDHALRKAGSIWERGLARTGELDLLVADDGFELPGQRPLSGPGLDDLARTLQLHHVLGLQVHPDLRAEELYTFVESLARDPQDLERHGRLRGTLQSAGVRHLALWELPTPSQGSGAAAASAPSAREPEPEARVAGELTVRLLRELADLDPCDQPVGYRAAAARVERTTLRLLEVGDPVNAYRAALVFARHAGPQEGRCEAIRQEAVLRLERLLADESMLQFAVDGALGAPGDSSDQAVAILRGNAAGAVARLIDAVEREVGGRARAALRELGESAVPALASELGSERPKRAQAAIRALGELRGDKATHRLALALRRGDPVARREVAGTLAKMATATATRVLCEALIGESDVALLAAQALGECPGAAAIDALCDVAEDTAAAQQLRLRAIRSLGRIGDPEALGTLGEILGHASFLQRKRVRPLRIAAARAIARIGGDDATGILGNHCGDGDGEVAQVCAEGLRRIGSAGQALPWPG